MEGRELFGASFPPFELLLKKRNNFLAAVLPTANLQAVTFKEPPNCSLRLILSLKNPIWRPFAESN